MKPRQLVNYHKVECPYENWVILRLGDFFGTGKTPSGGFTRADGRVRDRAKPGARAHPREGPRGRARVVFQLGRDREPAERNVVSAVTGALFTH